MRYFDLGEIVKFIKFCNQDAHVAKYNIPANRLVGEYFGATLEEIHTINMSTIKDYYLRLLMSLSPDDWPEIFEHFSVGRLKHIESSIYISTSDASTLTSGPTIYIAEDVDKIAQFLMQRAAIPSEIVGNIMRIINQNNTLNGKISKLEKDLEDGTSKEESKEKKMSDQRISPEMKRLMKTIDGLRRQVQSAALNKLFIPNTMEHLDKWQSRGQAHSQARGQAHGGDENRPYTSNISESTVEKIMMLSDIDSLWKIMLLMGIGVFKKFDSETYTEVMKEMATNQNLYLILASTDYIYGTNYQFCHGYIGKDIADITYQKLIQAMGRIGRNRLQQTYTIRFRNNDLIRKIWLQDETNVEADNMNRLFCQIKND
jgi:hypothetical protein